MRENAEKLLNLAEKFCRDKWGEDAPLAHAERTLIEKAAEGEQTQFTPGDDAAEKLEKGGKAPPDATIRAGVIRWMCICPEAAALIDVQRVSCGHLGG